MRYKTSFFIILLPFHMITASSYIEKGTWNISGSIYFTDNLTNDDYSEKYFDITTGVYYFVHKSISIGSDISYARMWDDDDITHYYTINPGVRLYFLTGNNIYPYIKMSGEYYLVKYSDGTFYDIIGTNYGFGIDYFIRKNIALEPYFNYHIMQRREDRNIVCKPRRMELGFSLAIFLP